MKIPLPGYFLAVLDKSQMSNVDFQGKDEWDLPNYGRLISLHKDDESKKIDSDWSYKSLINKRVYWAKYQESEFFYDDELNENVVFISLEKLRGYDK